MMTPVILLVAALVCPVATEAGSLQDNFLTDEEKTAGWILLFDGQTLNGWKTDTGQPSRVPVEDGAINPHGCGGYMLVHEREWTDFELALDFKMSPKCNSGIFVRTFPLTPLPGKDVGYNGIEMQIFDSSEAGYHDTGAIYDLAKPSRNAMKPVGEWNHADIVCQGSRIAVTLNGEKVTEAGLDQFTEPGRRPDGSEHKFGIAYRDHPRHGYIGLQDHGSPCWFKNIKIRPLSEAMEVKNEQSPLYHVSVNARGVKNRIVECKVRDHTVYVDQPKGFGADDTAPTPPEMLAVSLSSCVVSTIQFLAIQRNLDVSNIEVAVEGTIDFSKAMGIETVNRAGYSGLQVKVQFDSTMTAEEKRSFVKEVFARGAAIDNVENSTLVTYELVE